MQLKDSSSGLNLMSDSYILENILEEIKNRFFKTLVLTSAAT
jgi:hypothetical protein